jgi:hypothetical protein
MTKFHKHLQNQTWCVRTWYLLSCVWNKVQWSPPELERVIFFVLDRHSLSLSRSLSLPPPPLSLRIIRHINRLLPWVHSAFLPTHSFVRTILYHHFLVTILHPLLKYKFLFTLNKKKHYDQFSVISSPHNKPFIKYRSFSLRTPFHVSTSFASNSTNPSHSYTFLTHIWYTSICLVLSPLHAHVILNHIPTTPH